MRMHPTTAESLAIRNQCCDQDYDELAAIEDKLNALADYVERVCGRINDVRCAESLREYHDTILRRKADGRDLLECAFAALADHNREAYDRGLR